MGEPLVRVYGPTQQHDSWCRVALGMHAGLRACGRSAGVYAMEETLSGLDDGMPFGWDADVGVYVGPPGMSHVLTARGVHRRRLVMIAANSSWLPRRIMRKVGEMATELVAPSEWAASVLRSHSELPVTVWRHGVAPEFRPDSGLPRQPGPWRVLHLSSTTKQRKSTNALCEAWTAARDCGAIPKGAQLDLVLSGGLAGGADQAGPVYGMRFLPRLNMTTAGAAALYRSYDLVCQPSRAEGFGLVPLEARATGVPVCLTLCTGHREHTRRDDPGVVVTEHGQDTEIDDGPGATAPAVSVDAIADALSWAYEHREGLRADALAAAAEVGQRWSWRSVCQQWLDAHG